MIVDAVVAGLAENPAATEEVLLRLLREWPEAAADGLQRRATLPVQEAMAGHPLRSIRSMLGVHPAVDPSIRARLLDDEDWRVRWSAFGRRGQRPFPDDVLTRLMGELHDRAPGMRASPGELFEELTFWDRKIGLLAARHPDPRVRRLSARGTWWRDDMRFLLSDPDPEVAAEAAASLAEHERIMLPADLPEQHCHAFWYTLQRPLSRQLAEQVLASGDHAAIGMTARNLSVPADLVDVLLRYPDAEIRAAAACREELTAEQFAQLAADPDASVRAAAGGRADLPADHVVRLLDDPDDRVREAVAAHANLNPAERAMLDGPITDVALAARSAHPRLRRRAAQHHDLSLDLVAALAHDPDSGVRLELALHHPQAPAELLLRSYLEDPGQSVLPSRPGFPAAGLARFAGHADPRIRRLVALDPQADPAVLIALTEDPDSGVREAMARCPHLPADRIIALLGHPALARHAAANPAIDIESVLTQLALRS
ncbi:hypothetical protein FHR83_009260 [Actinoplanes campanulatus]|uniref:Leucine rich repeat variant n=1 Tax=Actinoplanes campanulatus TaxID=113559 RepID=A0A7W5FKB4_9ACTN|nr:hypothetical protein [Actinoplanes campanulatus]MBB3101531.1 hypothetical protein [Actinoplanes campanulatus]GGN51872.1 hypothetical protein GCM10010109_92370 [Actinoplanes campanulatus]GID42702.1 hypothetical protein Aca09nite_92080 [Actinoplanes campanulatus]